MKVVGLITEYNPFHNGHKYHIDEARRITGADYVIAIMSGNFVQRGTPALIDKYSRTRMALSNGVDLVLELPVCYSVGSAEYFAHGAVAVLNGLGVVDYLCFGSESGDINLLQNAAKQLLQAPASFDQSIKEYLKSGMTYPAARQKALMASEQPSPTKEKNPLSKVLTEPNNILGLEYLKAIQQLSSSMEPITIQRIIAHYHESELSSAASESIISDSSDFNISAAVISSATAIRGAIPNSRLDSEDLTPIMSSVPANVYQSLVEEYLKTYPISEEDFAQVIKYKLLSEDRNSLTEYLDISGDLADRMKNLPNLDCSINELSRKIKTKNLTHSRVNRALIHILLDIKTAELAQYKDQGYAYYARVLGMRREASPFLRAIKNASHFPIITKVSKAMDQLEGPGLRLLSKDIFATHLYQQIIYQKYGVSVPNEYRRGMLLL